MAGQEFLGLQPPPALPLQAKYPQRLPPAAHHHATFVGLQDLAGRPGPAATSACQILSR